MKNKRFSNANLVNPYDEKGLFDSLQHSDDEFERLISNFRTIRKDFTNNEKVKISKIVAFYPEKHEIEIETEQNMIVRLNLKKERKFFDVVYNTYDLEEINKTILENIQNENDLLNGLNLSVQVNPNKYSEYEFSLLDSYLDDKKEELIEQIEKNDKYYIAKIYDRNTGGFFATVEGLLTFIPGSLASANRIYDFDSLINTEIEVMVEDYLKSSKMFICSHKKYLEYILPEKIKELDLTKQYTGKVTGIAKYGIFVEFDKIFTGLIRKDEFTPETLKLFETRQIKPQDDINFYIKEISKFNDRLMLSQVTKNVWNILSTYENQTINCSKFSERGFGILYEFEIPDVEYKFRGLLLKKNHSYDDYNKLLRSNNYNLTIEKVDIEEQKIILTI